MLANTGERQVGETMEQIKPNHRHRYMFAAAAIHKEFEDTDKPLDVLDAACGIGYGTQILSQVREGSYLGVDVFPDAVEKAKECYKVDNSDYDVLDLSCEKSWKEKFGDKKFDAIVSIETIEHVEDADSLIKRFAQQTDFLVASVPNQDFVPFDPKLHPFHYRHYTKSEFEELLNKYGFEVDIWATQYNKIPGEVYQADDGMGFIVSARKKDA